MILSKFKNKIVSLYYNVISSIAFYPTLISVVLFSMAFVMLRIEDSEMTNFLIENAPYLVINDSDTGRAILTTLIGGIISLTVFSFSMVMVILNQASSNFSPRLLPGLISNKTNQIVLGVNIGTILYNIIVLISILPTENEFTLNGFSILIGIILGILCLSLFVFFIHNISQTIQIDNILEKIFDDCKHRLNTLINLEHRQIDEIPAVADKTSSVHSHSAGYFHGINIEGLLTFAQEQKTNVYIRPCKGEYLLPGVAVIETELQLDDEMNAYLRDLILFTASPNAEDNFVMGIKQITEVGIKAMSPGINDPGTAIMTIDHLTELFALRMKMSEYEVRNTADSSHRVFITTVNFKDLLFRTLAAYRQYCKHDVLLMEKIIHMINYLLNQPAHLSSYHDDLWDQLVVIEEDIKMNIQNSQDQKHLCKLIGKSNQKNSRSSAN